MTNGSWKEEWNKRAEFIEDIIKINCLDNEDITIKTEGNPNWSIGSQNYDPPMISIYYSAIRFKKQINDRWHIPPQLSCSLDDGMVVLIIKELLKSARMVKE